MISTLLDRSPMRHFFRRHSQDDNDTSSPSKEKKLGNVPAILSRAVDDESDSECVSDCTSIVSNKSGGSILPSYYMYNSILRRKFCSTIEQYSLPSYTLVNTNSNNIPISLTVSVSNYSIHEKLSSLPNERKLAMLFELEHPEEYEYRQGEIIKGHLTIENHLDSYIKFSLIYLLLEGYIHYAFYGRKPFLSLIDFNSFLHHKHHKLSANGFYRQPFEFKIPEYLVDNQCEEVMASHLEILPSVSPNSFCSLRISYELSCHVIYEDKLGKFEKLGELDQNIVIIPKYEPAIPFVENTLDYMMRDFITSDGIYVSKSRFDEVLQQLDLNPLKSELIFRGCDRLLKLTIEQPSIDFKYVPMTPQTPQHPDLNQLIKIPINILPCEENGQVPPLQSISADLIVITARSYRPIPICFTSNMFFESFTDLKYSDIITIPICKCLNIIRKHNPNYEDATNPIRKLLKIQVTYTPLLIPNVIVDENANISIRLKNMCIKALDHAVVKYIFGSGFSLVPNFQNCNVIREYYLHLELQFDNYRFKRNHKVIVNIPVNVIV